MYGMGIGSAISIGGLQSGALINFYLGRYLLRDWTTRKLRKAPKFLAIINGIEHGNAFVIILLTRLCPVIPFGLSGYVFGITKVGLVVYLLSTLCGRPSLLP